MPDEMDGLDSERVEQGDEVGDELRRSVPGRRRVGPTCAAEIGGDRSAVGCEAGQHRPPLPSVLREPVQQHRFEGLILHRIARGADGDARGAFTTVVRGALTSAA